MGASAEETIRAVTEADSSAICEIYNHYIEHSIITFEETPVAVEEMAVRIGEITAALPWYVFDRAGEVLGYAYASAWKSRCAYRYSAETTVYLAERATGQRIGTRLYERLISELRSKSFHNAIGGIALPNEASVALHESLGFEKVAHFKQVGWKFDRWIDVGYWELLLT
jgi:phosphinothricin acetyltransferase